MKPPGLICLLLLTVTSWSQTPVFPVGFQHSPQLRFEKLDFRQGLSSPAIQCIYQDHAGFLWIGTSFGLNRYDGIRFDNYFNEPGRPNSLIYNTVLSIAEDQDHVVWIGTDGGISALNPCTHHFTNYYPSTRRCIVYADQDNNIWIGSETGIAVLDPSRTRLKDITADLNRSDTSTKGLVNGFEEDQNYIWATTANGFFRINKKTQLAEPVGDKTDRVYSAEFVHISKDAKGRIWSANWGGQVVWWDPADKQVHNRTIDNVSIGDVVIGWESDREYIYISTYKGLIKMEINEFFSNKPVTYYQPDPKDHFSISHRILSDLFIDRDHNVWIGSESGLNKTDPSGLNISVFHYGHFNTDFAMQSMCTTDVPNEYYVLSGSHIFRIHRENGIIDATFFGNKYQCYDLYRAGDNYWMTINGGLLQLNKDLKVKAHHKLPLDYEARENRFRWIIENTDGSLWISTARTGIVRFDPKSNTIRRLFNDSSFPLDLSGIYIEYMLTDHYDRVWIGTSNGLFIYDQQKNTVRNINLCEMRQCGNVKGLYEYKDKMYICTIGGLYTYELRSGKVDTLPVYGQGISRFTNHVVADSLDRLWINTNNGLIIFDLATHKTIQYGQKNGLPYQDLWSPIYRFGDDIYTSSAASVIRFDAGRIKQDSRLPTPVFSSVILNDTSFIEGPAAPVLTWNGSIAFNFISLQYNHSAGFQYTYLLEGLDKTWHPVSSNSLRFSNLPAGSYSLQVKAINSDGTESQPAVYSFRVRPPVWKTAWFIGLVILVVGAAIYAFYRYRIRQAVRLERMRMRIATDLHDDIGATLSSISMYSDAVKKQVRVSLPHLEPVLNKMGENSRNMVSSMSDIVWAIDPNNDEGEKLLERMENYGRDNCSVKNTRFIFTADKKVNAINLPPEIRKNIYLVFKEAINNSLKYSEATEIAVDIHTEGKTLSMTIFDNGKGFEEKHITKGNGLQNMRQRAKEIDARFTISSTYEGTVIHLEHRLNWV